MAHRFLYEASNTNNIFVKYMYIVVYHMYSTYKYVPLLCVQNTKYMYNVLCSIYILYIGHPMHKIASVLIHTTCRVTLKAVVHSTCIQYTLLCFPTALISCLHVHVSATLITS